MVGIFLVGAIWRTADNSLVPLIVQPVVLVIIGSDYFIAPLMVRVLRVFSPRDCTSLASLRS